MAWDRRKLAALAACSAAYLSVLSCNGAEFNSGTTPGDSGSGGTAGKVGSGGKAAGGTGQGGKAGASGSATSGSPSTGGDVNPGTGGDTNPGGGTNPMGGSGGQPGSPIPKESLLYWFTGDVGVSQDDGGVVEWADQSGHGFHAVQLVASLRPKLATTGGMPLPFLELDGQDDYLELPELEVDWGQGLSLFVVAGSNTTSGCSAFVELSNGAEIDDINLGVDGEALQYEISSEVLTAPSASFLSGELRLAEAHHGGTPDQAPAELRVNGAQATVQVMTLPAPALRISNFVGKSLYANCLPYSGAIAEIIFYSRKVSVDERIAIEKYLAAKWGCCN